METQPASGLVVVMVSMHICVVAFLVLTQADDSTRYASTSGLLVVMFPEFDIDSPSAASSLAAVARLEEMSSSGITS